MVMGDDGSPPRPTGRVGEVFLEGMLLLWRGEQPVLLRVAGGVGHCIPVFSSLEAIATAAAEFSLRYERIRQVSDARQFAADMGAQRVAIIVDPHVGANGKIRYLSLRVQNDEAPALR